MAADLLGFDAGDNQDWPKEAEDKYLRLEILGKGSFGMVWMAQRMDAAVDDEDEEYVAIKNIHIKDKKGSVYAEREISILHELRHPNIIRLIRTYDLYNSTRLVVMQLARGPNLHQLVVKRGALGLPLCRLVSRQLIAAVGYMHGRAVIHRGTYVVNVQRDQQREALHGPWFHNVCLFFHPSYKLFNSHPM